MRSILNQAISVLASHKSAWATLSGFLTVLTLGGMAAYGITPETQVFDYLPQETLQTLDTPAPHLIEGESRPLTRQTYTQTSDTFDALLTKLSVRDEEIRAFLHSLPKSDPIFRQIYPGKLVTASVSRGGDIELIDFPVGRSGSSRFSIRHDGERFRIEQHPVATDQSVVTQSAIIRYSLFGATDGADIPDAVAAQFVDIFSSDIDFHRDLRKGDKLTVIYEASHYQGKVVRTQRILAAEFINGGKKYQAYWYKPKEGNGAYYTPEGKSMRKTFLRSPLEFTRISSGFTNARFHPVLQTTRAHQGTDYAAPRGTKGRWRS